MYTRKRTVIACNFCRRRKRKCDGKKPCATCVDASAECAYQELPLDKIEESVPAAVTERLGRIEAILEQQFQQIYQLNARAGQSPYPTSQSDHTSENQGNLVPLPPDFNPSLESFPFLIPKNHTAVAAALITCPQVRNVVGEYEQDCFLEMEEKLPLPGLLDRIHDGPLTWPVLVSQTVDTLTANYFQYVHPHQPLFTPQMFESWQKTLLGAQNLDGNAAAICLCVYALGVLSSPQSGGGKAPETLGLEYFQPALKIIIREVLWGFRPGILACTALLLSASYFAHLGRPVHSLRMGHFASRAFLNILESRQNNPTYAELDDAEVRVYWQCFMIECDGIAELDTSRSGIEPLENTMPLPHRLGQSDDRCHIYSITEYTIRRLLNRIISTLYSPDSAHQYLRLSPDPVGVWQPPCLRKLSSVSAELDRQLEQWYSSIPDYLRFSKGTSFLPDDRSRVLRLRYYMARHLIYRPFLLQTVSMQHKGRSQPQSSLVAPDSFSLPDPVVMDRCQTCIDSCVTYLYNAADMIDKRSPYLWTFSQNCIATLVLLWLAENSAPISHLVPATRPIQSVILEKLRRWAVGSSSLDIGVQIVERLMFLDHP
ncbi:putative c6 finger domain protein [Rosellinia necatrix]|uniref:Putative c6 finger domain protein n=1 Tax=Rosellinia necatrix TaxID=77044 RepID=A0A1W2TED0_ROSNE|nr:putative c6 finger domain protein [Rosellinia necatrix]